MSKLFTKQKTRNLRQLAVLVIAILSVMASVTGFVGGRAHAGSLEPPCNGITRYVSLQAGSKYVHYPTRSNGADVSPYCHLRRVYTGGAVWVLQDAMKRCYGQNIAVDAIYGNDTHNAVLNVQSFHGWIHGDFESRMAAADMLWPTYHLGSNAFTGCEWFPFRQPGWVKG